MHAYVHSVALQLRWCLSFVAPSISATFDSFVSCVIQEWAHNNLLTPRLKARPTRICSSTTFLSTGARPSCSSASLRSEMLLAPLYSRTRTQARARCEPEVHNMFVVRPHSLFTVSKKIPPSESSARLGYVDAFPCFCGRQRSCVIWFPAKRAGCPDCRVSVS
jgi:hypothetical protein